MSAWFDQEGRFTDGHHIREGYGPPRSHDKWLIDGADLLARPDPGPTPWLVDGLIVDRAIVACVGRWKVTKSYGLLDICISIATGEPAFGKFAIPEPGPVIYVIEESGEAALWRRLDALCRGRGIDPEQLRGRLMLAANKRVKLDDPGWQRELVDVGAETRPRLFAFDPLARLKAADREEKDQGDMSVLIDYLRLLRDETDAATLFVHHTGHLGEHMRGSSDLESAWETKLKWKRDGQSPLVEIISEHREEAASDPFKYRIAWDGETRTMRFDVVGDETGPSLSERIVKHLSEHGPGTTDDVRKAVGVRKSDVLRTLEALEQAGTTHRGPSGRADQLGRAIRDKAWHLSTQAPLWVVPENGNNREQPQSEDCGSVPGPPYVVGDGSEQPPERAG